jgi:hypothetical protein
MPFWAIAAFKQRRIYRLLLKVTIEMQTVGGSMMKLSVVQPKDLSDGNPTTLDPTRAKIIIRAL